MANNSRGFISGFVVATVLVGAVAAWSVGEIYVTNPDGDWIRDPLVYAPGTADQINVLGDLQPGAAEAMFNVGLRLNTLNAAGKKQNWKVAAFQAEEIEEAFDRLMVTRPAMAPELEAFITGALDPVIAAVTAPTPSKTAFTDAFDTMVAACNTCHVNNAMEFMVVKPGKSAEPLQF